jgi:hypothetical protein
VIGLDWIELNWIKLNAFLKFNPFYKHTLISLLIN